MLIDFHTHIFPDRIAKHAIENLEGNIIKMQGKNYSAISDGTLDGLKATMKRDGVDFSVVLPIATTVKQSTSINSFAESINGRDGIISFGSVHPMQKDFERVLEGIKESGLLGIKLHPEYQDVFVSSKEVIDVVKKADELGLYVVFHAGRDIGMPEPVHCMPSCLNGLLDYVDGSRIIAAHMGGWREWDDVERYIVGTPIKLDTSYLAGHISAEQFKRIVKNHGSENILFGTDNPWMTAAESQAFMESVGLDKSELDNIYYKNAMRILNLSV